MKAGILGGTFDPVHCGHLEIARRAAGQLKLATVIFVPAGQPWLKTDRRVTAAHHRVAMLKLAMEGQPGFEISTTEVEREGPSYTVDTLREIRRIVDKNTEIFFIVGWDTLEELPLWKEPEELVRLCRLVAVSRPGHQRPDIEALEHAVPGIVKSTILLEIPPIAISSTEIRAYVKAGKPLDQLVPEKVAGYIGMHRLYI